MICGGRSRGGGHPAQAAAEFKLKNFDSRVRQLVKFLASNVRVTCFQSVIEFKHLKWTNELLTRSRSAPLDVYFEDGLRSPVKIQALQKILTEHKLKTRSYSRYLSGESMGSKIFVLNDPILSLAAMHLLETLVLCNICKTGLPAGLHSNIIAELHNLPCFKVDNPFFVYEALLPCLVYPKTTRQRFILSSFQEDQTGQSEYLQSRLSDLQCIGHLIGRRIPLGRCIHISDDSETTHIAVWDRAGLVSCPPTGIPNLQFNLSPPPGAEDFCFHHAHKVACVSALWGALPLARLESLHIDSTTIDCMIWSNFGKKNLLKNIRLRIGCSPRTERNFIEELQSGIPDKDISNVLYAHPKPSKLPFRALQNLILDGWTGDSLGYDFTSTSWLHLCLRERRKRGVALRQLRFLRTIKPRDNHFEEVFEKVLAVVPQVYWDVKDSPVDGGEVTDNA
ncbi:hypothetical protein DXG01_004800 [Tephrocybe rancida]|nr:hypothetical protein DXG01_004800 [Tephrocybe rancida]